MQKPNAETDAVARRAFIEAKYVQKAFLHPLPSASQARASTRKIKRWIIKKNSIANDTDDDTIKTPNRQLMTKRTTPSPDHETVNQDNSPLIWDMNIYLYEAAHQQNVMMMLHALALGADKNFINEHDHGRTPLIQTILSRSVAAAEFLLTNNAKVNLADQNGKTPLHYATQLANKGRG
ncbi:unnamed protein product, partial [Adineta steineri]